MSVKKSRDDWTTVAEGEPVRISALPQYLQSESILVVKERHTELAVRA